MLFFVCSRWWNRMQALPVIVLNMRRFFFKYLILLQVSVNTSLCNLTDYLASLLKNTNMKCLTPDKALSGECGFMAANLYAKVSH